MVTTTMTTRKRCPLCLAILVVESVSASGAVTRVESPDHTQSSCEAATLSRIRVLEEMHVRDGYRMESDNKMIEDLGAWIGISSTIVEAGRRWLEHRQKRSEDIARLRSAFGTNERATQHPLWQAEEEVATAIQQAIDIIEERRKS